MHKSIQRQLDIFAQVVISGDLYECARALRLSIETIEAELDALEARLGYTLFKRSLGAATLTPAGRNAISALEMLSNQTSEQWARTPETLQAEAALAEAEAEAEEGDDSREDRRERRTARQASEEQNVTPANDSDEPTIRPPRSFRPLPSPRASAPDSIIQNIVLAAHPGIFGHFQEALTAFEATSPDTGITLRLEGLSAEKVPDLFARGLADIAYFYALEEPWDFASRYAWSERITLFIAANHPLANADSVLASDLEDVPYLALEEGNIVRHLSEAALAKVGATCPPPIAESDNLYQLMTMVQQGKGYFAALGPTARDFGKMKNVSRIAYAQGLPQIEVRQAIRPEMAADAAVCALAEYLFR